MSKSFPHLLSPGRIGPMELRNRILLTAMGTSFAEEDGSCGDRIVAFNDSIARGGTGLVTMGVVGVGWPLGNNMRRQPAISEDRFIPGMRRVADVVHAAGAKFAVQLHFGGLVANPEAGQPAWCPSIPVPGQLGAPENAYTAEEIDAGGFATLPPLTYHEMTSDDVTTVIAMFAAGARRACEAGADGLEVHAGHGYLFSSFLSPVSNRRTDDYGGTLENRARLLTDVLRAVRTEVGEGIALWSKIDAVEYQRAGGIRLEDAIATARLAEAAGADAITTTAYHDNSVGALHSGSHTPQVPALNADKAAAIRAAVGIPVILSGRIEPERGESAIAKGEADFIAMGRKLLADPELPKRLAEDKPAKVRPCIYCYTCISEIYVRQSARCVVRPETGFEEQSWLSPVAIPKSIAIIGGGPAGMEAARRLSARGHVVTLLERNDKLGGTLRFASIAYEPNERILDWLEREVTSSPVDVRLKTDANAETLRLLSPDAVIVASGARRDLPPIPGADLPHVLGGDELRALILGETAPGLEQKFGFVTRLAAKAGAATGLTQSPAFIREASRRWLPLGKRIVIIGGDLVGLELAEFLAERGRKVTVVDESAPFGRGLPIVRRWRLLDELRHLGVTLLPGHADIAVTTMGVTAAAPDGKPGEYPADHVIIAKGATGDLSLARSLEAEGFAVHAIGDCNGVGYIDGAMRAAATLAATL